MSESKYKISLFDKDTHKYKDFDSGNYDLDFFLKKYSIKNSQMGLIKTYVLTLENSFEVLGYYSSCMSSMDSGLFKEDYKLPNHPVSGLLVARLAVDLKARNQRIGGRLLGHAIKMAKRISLEIGCFAVFVDAKDDNAISFYKHFNFKETPKDKFLYLKI